MYVFADVFSSALSNGYSSKVNSFVSCYCDELVSLFPHVAEGGLS